MKAPIPLAVVGATWRTAPTEIRAELVRIAAEPLASLRQSGHILGAVSMTTCSRTEWLLSAPQPEWAASLFQSALQTRLSALEPSHLHLRAGAGAGHHVLRVASGLDSVAQGESAVGRQVLKAFEHARDGGMADSVLKRVWRHVERLIHGRRHSETSADSRGVQALVREVLSEHQIQKVAVLGRGEFGQAMERALRGGAFDVSTWTRSTAEQLFARMTRLDALVVCTGATHTWLNLPPRNTPGLCVDVGSPPQVHSAPGWTLVGLDQLLARPELQLSDVERDRLEALIAESANHLCTSLSTQSNSAMLAAIDAERTAFLHDQLPALLAGLPKHQIAKVRRAVGAFAHTLLKRTRENSP